MPDLGAADFHKEALFRENRIQHDTIDDDHLEMAVWVTDKHHFVRGISFQEKGEQINESLIALASGDELHTNCK